MTPRPRIVTHSSRTLQPHVLSLCLNNKNEKRVRKACNRFSTFEYNVSIKFHEVDPISKQPRPITEWSSGAEGLVDDIMARTDCLKSHRGTVVNMCEYVAALRNSDLPRPVPSTAFLALVDVKRTYCSFECKAMASTSCANVIEAVLDKDIQLAAENLNIPPGTMGWTINIEKLTYPLEIGHRQEDIPNTKYQLDMTIGAPMTMDSAMIAKYRAISKVIRQRLPELKIAFDGPREEKTGDRSRSITWTKVAAWTAPSVKTPASNPRLSWSMQFLGMGPANADQDIMKACMEQIPELLKVICREHDLAEDTLTFSPLLRNKGVPHYEDQLI